MEPPARKRCARCGKRLKKGGTSYELRAELASSFDGYINETAGDIESKLKRIEKEVEGLGEKELEEQVYKNYKYTVCPVCRDEIDRFLDSGENT